MWKIIINHNPESQSCPYSFGKYLQEQKHPGVTDLNSLDSNVHQAVPSSFLWSKVSAEKLRAISLPREKAHSSKMESLLAHHPIQKIFLLLTCLTFALLNKSVIFLNLYDAKFELFYRFYHSAQSCSSSTIHCPAIPGLYTLCFKHSPTQTLSSLNW